MTTGSMIFGRAAVAGLIVFTPEPGIANVMVSRPGLVFALTIACRSEPIPVSFVFVTVKGLAMVTAFENAEVFEAETLVAVAVNEAPSGAGVAEVKDTSATPAEFVVTVWVPNRVRPWFDAGLLRKYSIAKLVFAVLVN